MALSLLEVAKTYKIYWVKWGGGRGIWQVKILLGVYNLNVTGPGGECGQY